MQGRVWGDRTIADTLDFRSVIENVGGRRERAEPPWRRRYLRLARRTAFDATDWKSFLCGPRSLASGSCAPLNRRDDFQ
jgi:hypothetical protein